MSLNTASSYSQLVYPSLSAGNCSASAHITNHYVYRNEFQTAIYLERVLFDSFERNKSDPNTIAIAWSLRNKRLVEQEDYAEAYQSCLCLIEYNRKRGSRSHPSFLLTLSTRLRQGQAVNRAPQPRDDLPSDRRLRQGPSSGGVLYS